MGKIVDGKAFVILAVWMLIGTLAGLICGLIDRKKSWRLAFRTVFFLGLGFIFGVPLSGLIIGNQYSWAKTFGTLLGTLCCWIGCRIVWWLFNRNTPTIIRKA